MPILWQELQKDDVKIARDAARDEVSRYSAEAWALILEETGNKPDVSTGSPE
jgi:hypothetical protein